MKPLFELSWVILHLTWFSEPKVRVHVVPGIFQALTCTGTISYITELRVEKCRFLFPCCQLGILFIWIQLRIRNKMKQNVSDPLNLEDNFGFALVAFPAICL